MLARHISANQLYLITPYRAGDYMDLQRGVRKIREWQIALRIAGFAIAGLFALLATVFLGLAIIVSFWDSDYRALAAWFVVILFGAIAGISLNLCLKHFRSPPITTNLRSQLQRDIDVIKESL